MAALLVKADSARWRPLIKKLGIKASDGASGMHGAARGHGGVPASGVNCVGISGLSGKRMSAKALRVDLPIRPVHVEIVTLKGRTISPVARLFIECARKIAKPLAKAR